MRFIINTNEYNVYLANIVADSYLKYGPSDMKLAIVSNKLPQDIELKDNIDYYESGIKYHQFGDHFKDTLLSYLDSINDDYIFFFCDDFLLLDYFKEDQYKNLLNYIKQNNIDYACFDEIAKQFWVDFKVKEEDFDGVTIRERNEEYQHLFSVQPCIWKRESFIELLNSVDENSIWHIDNTSEQYRNANKYNNIGFNAGSHMTFKQKTDKDYYVLSYIELIRHGVFYHESNGHPKLGTFKLLTDTVENFIEEYDLINNNNFKQLISNYEKTA